MGLKGLPIELALLAGPHFTIHERCLLNFLRCESLMKGIHALGCFLSSPWTLCQACELLAEIQDSFLHNRPRVMLMESAGHVIIYLLYSFDLANFQDLVG